MHIKMRQIYLQIIFYVVEYKMSLIERLGMGGAMENRFRQYNFDINTLREMDNFKNDFLANQYKMDKSENNGPNYKENELLKDQKAFEEYLESDEAQDFLNLV